MNGQKVGYARVSAVDQNLDRQLAALNEIGMDKLFTDKYTGARIARPGLEECRRYLREGDVLYVASIDRLARNLSHLQELVSDFQTRRIGVCFLKENLKFGVDGATTPMDRLLLQIMGSFAEFERALIRERQQEGINAARAAGKPMGRPKAISGKKKDELEARLLAGESTSALAREYGISRATACRIKAAGKKRQADK